MADFEEGRQGRLSRNISTEDMTTTSGRRGKPEIEIYRPGSGKLRRSAGGHGDFEGPRDLGRYEDKQRLPVNNSLKYNQNNTPRKSDVNRVTDDFDRLSVSSNSSRNRDRHVIGAEITNNSSNSDSRKRNKKPEVALYVPKPLAEAYAEHDNRLNNESDKNKTPRNNFRNDTTGRRERSRKQSIDEVSNISETSEINRSLNDLSSKSERPRRSKAGNRQRSDKPGSGRNENIDENIRMNGIDDVKPTPLMDIKFASNTLEALKSACNNDSTGYETTDGESESKDSVKQYIRPKTNNIYDDDRVIRQASEPRSLPPSYSDTRIRDTRSVEPDSNWGYDKIHSKPPSGHFARRGKVSKHYSHPSFDSLPPRLQKKYIAENGLQEPLIMQTTYIGTNSEELWDGSSVTFQGSNANLYYSNVPPPSSFTQPPPSMVYTQMPPPPPQMWSQTLPPSGSRGRGRLRPEDMDIEAPRYARSLTPDSNSTIGHSKSSSEQYEENMKDSRIRNEQHNGRRREQDRELKTVGERDSQRRLEENKKVQKNGNQRNGNKDDQHRREVYRRESESDLRRDQRRRESDSDLRRAVNRRESESNLRRDVHRRESESDLRRNLHRRESESDSRRDMHRKESKSDTRPSKNQNDTKVQATDNKTSVEENCILKLSTQNIVDWAEEVERNEIQRELHQSSPEADLPRTTSLNSLQDSSRQSHYREKRRRRKRSLSRDRVGRSEGRRRGSVDNGPHKSRNNSTERRYNRSRGDNRDLNELNRNWRDRGSESRNSSIERWTSNRDNRDLHYNESRQRNNSGDRYRRNDSDIRSISERYRGNVSNDKLANDHEQNRRNHSNDRSGFKGSNQDLRYRSHSKERQASRTHSSDRNKIRSEENWRSETSRTTTPAPSGSTNNSQRQEAPAKDPQKPAGILVLPPSTSPNPLTSPHKEMENFNHNSVNRNCVVQQQRQLFDPSNPNKPIIVSSQSGRISYPMILQHGSGQPVYGPNGELLNQGRFPNFHDMHNPHLWIEIERADFELQRILSMGKIFDCWPTVTELRRQVEKALRILLSSDIKVCEQENIEQYVWKILYYNIIEYLRNGMNEFPENRDQYRQLIINIIEEGTGFFEQCIQLLEEQYKFKLEDYLPPNCTSTKGKGYLTLALISTQKMLLFLGDLSRYKEQANGSTTYGFARQWYMKAHQLNPKNGRPYNQLAILAIYARRKLDAVYYYMRSLMASVPVASARESLLSLFDENRKKYELTETKRREEREAKEKERMKEKELGSRNNNRLRKEIWIHPDGGRRVHRTTSTSQHSDNSSQSEEDELAAMSELEVNKRFGMSFLHVHGKLFTKIGMETFQEAALQMLREFRALLQHSPLPLNPNRLLQLLALNMFSIENTQLKNSQVESNYRSALQESALVVSLQMFNLILERCIQLLKQDEVERQKNETNVKTTINTDIQYLLPAIKIWCDWLLCHSAVWNPPPSCRDYRVGTPGDIWSRLATLVNLLERLVSQYKDVISTVQHKDFVLVRLSEDGTLGGFNPLMPISQEQYYANKDENMEVAEMCLRIERILFFGTVYLCGVDPPVLKLHKSESGESEYISVVETPSPPEQSDNEVCVESFSSEGEGEGESEESSKAIGVDGDSEKPTTPAPEIQSLLHRKEQLEQSHRRQEQRRKQVQTILQQSTVIVEMEVRPHFLVPDTNCYIDYLPQLQQISRAMSSNQQHLYTLMVPLVVLNELDGLARGQRDPGARPAHVVMVTEAARAALDFLRSRSTTHPTPAIRCVTTKGTILNSAIFTSEQDIDEDMKNDDRILATCLNLCRTTTKDQTVEREPRHIYREVVLLTEDRNLRVKALARDMPVREVPDFMKWAGLGNGSG